MASKTREKLIEVARQLFAHQGVAHTTMNDIANASSKGRRTIYTYFKSKKDIYDAVLEQESERMVDSLRAAVAMDAPVETRLRRFLTVRLTKWVPVASSSFKSWISFDSKRINKVRAMAREKEEEMLRQILREGCDEGCFNRQKCQLVEAFMCSSASSAVDVSIQDADILAENEKALASFVEFIISGIKA